MAVRSMLVMPDGPSRRVGAAGLVIGRQDDCDIVVGDPAVSRRHVLVRASAGGAEVVPLGRAPVDVNGKPQDKACALTHGDQLRIGALVLHVVVEHDPDAAPTGFVLARERGGSFGMSKLPFTIGGGASDDLMIAEWPAAMLAIDGVGADLFVTLRTGAAALSGEPLTMGLRTPLALGEQISGQGESLVVHPAREIAATTDMSGAEHFPSKVRVELLPRGGLAVFTLPMGDHTVFLADKRFDLLMALIQPPGGYVHGQFVDDDVVRATVWPRNPGVGRPEINVLISRCRRDLVEAGLNGGRIIQRAPGGGGTRLVLTRDAEIVVKR